MTSRPLFRTIHGSHLYGMATDFSDRDYYEVVPDNPSLRDHFCQQTIKDGIDVTVIDLSTWLHYVEIGVPQACEAMFSTKADIDTLGALRRSYRLTSTAWDRYLRTAINFAQHEGDFKRIRHGYRLALNLRDIYEKGRFEPTLDADQIQFVNDMTMATLFHGLNPTRAISNIAGIER